MLVCAGAGGAYLSGRAFNGQGGFIPVVETRAATPTKKPTKTPAPPTATRIPKPTKTPAPPTPTRTPKPTKTPVTPTLAPPTRTPSSYQILINRRMEDKGILVLRNNSGVDLPMKQLVFQAGRRKIAGTLWDVTQLEPGACLVASNKKPKDTFLPEGVTCERIEKTVRVGSPDEVMFKEELNIFFRDVEIGTCEKEQLTCDISFTG